MPKYGVDWGDGHIIISSAKDFEDLLIRVTYEIYKHEGDDTEVVESMVAFIESYENGDIVNDICFYEYDGEKRLNEVPKSIDRKTRLNLRRKGFRNYSTKI